MTSLRTLVLALALAAAPTAFAATVPYTIDSNHTQVLFSYDHLGLSHITGSFEKVEGTFDFDPADPTRSKITVTIPIDSVSTGVPKLDTHLESEDFFDIAKFPTATFASTSVTAAGKGKLKVAGNLTVHGITRPVVLAVTINKIGDHPMAKVPAAGFDATTTLKRSDFGLDMMVPAVGDEISIRITLEARKPKA